VTTGSFIKPTVPSFTSYLQLNFGTTITPSFTQLSPRGGVYLMDVFGVTGNNIQVSFRDYAGVNVAPNSPNTNMKFYFESDVWVRQDLTTIFINFMRKGVIVNPLHMASNTGNFWVIGKMDRSV
jgi:hypothetical protein